jgi:hypothetical protein
MGKGTGGFWLNSPPLHPLSRDRQRQGRVAAGASVWWPGGVLPGPTAAGGRGKGMRGARAFYYRTHLGLGRLEGVDRRRHTEGGGGARGRRCSKAQARGTAVLVWCDGPVGGRLLL